MSPTPHKLEFSTDTLPERDRFPYYREEFGRSIVKLDLMPFERRPIRDRAVIHLFDNLGLGLTETNGNIGRRTKALVADGNDDLLFVTHLSGVSEPSQLGRELTLRAGSAVMMSAGEVGRHAYPGPARSLGFRLPRHTLAELLPHPEDRLMREVPPTSEALRLLTDYTAAAMSREPLTSPRLRHLFATHVHDLIAVALGASGDVAELARARGLQAARLHAVKADILAQLNDRIAISNVAGRQGVTPRYIQMLFEAEGTTFSQYVLGERLALAYRMLTDTVGRERAISTIALEAGFSNISYFNRAFRRVYGATPSDVRAGGRPQS